MNRKLIKENKKLDLEVNALRIEIAKVNEFLREESEHYTKEGSIKALKKIREILYLKQKQYKEKIQEEYETRMILINSCKHEIIFGDDLNTNCLFCQNNILTKKPPTTILEIKIRGSWEDSIIKSHDENNGKYLRNRIKEIVDEGVDKEDLLYIEEKLEELQEYSNIKIRRYKK